MHPALFEFGSHSIRSYGAMLSLGALIASTLTIRAASRAGLDLGKTLATMGVAALCALVGADVLFVIVEWIRTGDPTHALIHGGLVFYGALFGGLIGAYVMARVSGLDPFRLFDLAAPALAAGHAIGRLGCFLAGCCFGSETHVPWGVVYTDSRAPASIEAVPRHPTPLYESFALVLLASVLAFVPIKRVGSGARIAAYLIGYGLIRLVTEGTRGDAIRGAFGGWSTSRVIALVSIAFAIVVLYARRLEASCDRSPSFLRSSR